jgi:uncharacterized membrane protein (Fun14 family)
MNFSLDKSTGRRWLLVWKIRLWQSYSCYDYCFSIIMSFMLKRIMKILAVIAGVFFAALLYLESQHIVNVNWDKLQTISNGILSTITTATNATSTTGGGGIGSIQAFLGNNSTAAAAATHILPQIVSFLPDHRYRFLMHKKPYLEQLRHCNRYS